MMHLHSVVVYYTHLKNFFLQTPMKVSLIPLDIASSESSTSSHKYRFSLHLFAKLVALGAHIARQYLFTRLVHILFDNLISENAARFIAMDQSTNNAEKYLRVLRYEYNKSRQSLITREIAELSSNMDELCAQYATRSA